MSLRKKGFTILFVMLFLLTSGCMAEEGIAAFAKEDPVNTNADLQRIIEESLKNGETEISFETTELEKEDLDELNKSQDGYYGTVKSYEITIMDLLGISKVTLNCEISDNYYVERALLHGEEIPEDRTQAKELLKACEVLLPEIEEEKTEYDREQRIHDLLVEDTKYGFRKGDEGDGSAAYSSYGALVENTAVCNGYAQAMKLLCDLSGLECRMVVGKADGENHAWNLVKLDDSWYHVDVTWDDPKPDDPDRVFYHYFNVDDDMIAIDHTWDADAYPKADSEAYNYYVLNDLTCSNYEEFQDLCEVILSEEGADSFQIQVKDYDEDTYSEDHLQFLFHLTDKNNMNIQTVGKAPCVTIYLRFS